MICSRNSKFADVDVISDVLALQAHLSQEYQQIVGPKSATIIRGSQRRLFTRYKAPEMKKVRRIAGPISVP